MRPDPKSSKPRHSEHGGTLTLFALSIVAMFFLLGLSIDLGAAYVTRSRLSKSVDAGVLAGARNTSQGDAKMEEIALRVASANHALPNQPVTYNVQITTPAVDTKRISMTASTDNRTTFAVLMGKTSIDVGAGAEATRYPLDMSLSLDLSQSLQRNGVFDDMQDAAIKFLKYFSDSTDQVGISSYSTWGMENTPVQKFFKVPGENSIRAMTAISDTNIQEGLRKAKDQLDNAFARTGATKVVVLFTDGRPTAYRDQHTFVDLLCQRYNGVIATYISGESYRGLFRHQDGRRVTNFRNGCSVDTAANSTSGPLPIPTAVLGTTIVNGSGIRAAGVVKAEEMANEIRAAGYTIYTVGLGNPDATDPGDTPDQDFLRRLANEQGRVNSSQPRGQMFFAPSAAELDNAFAQLADRLLTRLTR